MTCCGPVAGGGFLELMRQKDNVNKKVRRIVVTADSREDSY